MIMGIISSEAKIRPRVRILPSRGISQRYSSTCRSFTWVAISHLPVVSGALFQLSVCLCFSLATDYWLLTTTNPKSPWPASHPPGARFPGGDRWQP